MPLQLAKFMIVCGHYGTGKTNLAINMAIDAKKNGRKVTLVDLDIVNPYFRSSDYIEVLDRYGIELAAPIYARSNLDIPALPPSMYAAFESEGTVIIDAGGDDAGATVLGRFADIVLSKNTYMMLYVVNQYRILTQTADEAAMVLSEIETAARLTATHIVNNSHLSNQTTQADIINSMAFANDVALKTKLPVLFTSVKKELCAGLDVLSSEIYPVDIFVKTGWD